MKKFLVLIILSLLVLTSCKTTSHVKCDAYSINENNEEYRNYYLLMQEEI